MKTSLSLPVLDGAGNVARRPWRSPDEHQSLAQLAQAAATAPAFDVAEFPAESEPPSTFTSRRGFVQLLGAGLAAGAAGCLSAPADKILPYTRAPAGVVPGVPLHYATMATLGGYATGVLVTAWEGRPTKIEGNPDHPSSLGSPGLIEQASLNQLYDPNRAREARQQGVGRALRTFFERMKALGDRARANGGAGLRFLLDPNGSPLLADLRGRLAKAFPRAKLHAWSPVSRDDELEGARIAFGRDLETRYDLTSAKVIASLDRDFLSALPGNLAAARQFSAGRDPAGGVMNRLYVAESQLTVTGATADHRLRVRAADVGAIARALVAQISPAAGVATPPLPPEAQKWVAALARDLRAAGANGAVMVGPRQPPAVHAIGHAINAALGSKHAVQQRPVFGDDLARTGPAALKALAGEMRAGTVDTLVITAWNPVHSAPKDVDFGQALNGVANSVYASLYEDETADRCAWFVPLAHELEAWGDGRGHDGTVTLRQPLIAPLFNGITEADVLAAFLGDVQPAYQRLRAFHGADDQTWRRWIGDGLKKDSARPREQVSVRTDAVAAAARQLPGAGQGIEVVFAPDYKVYDGRYANNSWLQELPDPITKLCWDNAVLVSPATAKRLGVASGDIVELELKGNKVRAAALIVPGQADDSVTLPLGYGRRNQRETVCAGVGFNANALRRSDAPWIDSGATITRTGEVRKLALTHTHWSMEGRAIALDVKLTELHSGKLPPEIEEQRHDFPVIYQPYDYSKATKWGMAIDLSKCTGCSACVIACQSENNIPVVGYEQVLNNREMHWLRIDRYYQGDLNDPQVITQPVACVHCELAPCEYVCPVNATVHSDEGLNEMVYNRCVGTRYCSNNCPYKVRRFNFLRYNNDYTNVEKMKFNPDVTVRGRGVMEKCTYCVQRIERARIETRVQGRPLEDGDVQTACQTACPAQAIVFGALNDPGSRVAKLQQQQRSYRLLNELNTKPRTWHLARVRNPNPELG